MLRSRFVITRGVIDMATSAILSSEGYIHTGVFAECEGEGDADLAIVTRAVQEIGELAKASGVKVDKQLGEITEFREKADARILNLEQKVLAGAGAGGGGNVAGVVPNLGEIVAKALDFGALQNRHAWVRQPIAGSIRQILKSVLVNTGTSGASPETGFPTIGVELPGGPFGFTHRRLSILSALTSIPVTSAKVEFPKLTDNTDNAQVQADEGAAKASTDLGFIMEILPMATIAHYVTASKQVLADSPLLVEFINQVMLFSALKRFENLIVSGNGTTDKVSGLLTQGTTYVPAKGHASDMIGETIASLTSLGFTPNLVIMNAFDYFDIISARDANGRYLAGGWSAASPTSLWGVPTVPTAALAAGTAIAMDTTVVRVLDREEANLQVGFQNDNFVKNEVTLLAELRGNLAVQNPQGVDVISIANDSP
jgi:HK97 family phage major capsid protein